MRSTKRNKRRYKTNRIKKTVSYSTSEVAELVGVHPRTVQQWYKDGLPKIDNKRPFLILGTDLKAFLEEKRKSKKRTCRDDEIYCVKCHHPRVPVNRLVDILIYNHRQASVKGVCGECGNDIYRFAAVNKIPDLGKIFVIQAIRHKDLLESDKPDINTDTGEGTDGQI